MELPISTEESIYFVISALGNELTILQSWLKLKQMFAKRTYLLISSWLKKKVFNFSIQSNHKRDFSLISTPESWYETIHFNRRHPASNDS